MDILTDGSSTVSQMLAPRTAPFANLSTSRIGEALGTVSCHGKINRKRTLSDFPVELL